MLFNEWTGDVWKVAFELANSSDLEFILMKIDHGVGVLRARSAGAVVQNIDGIADKDFAFFCENINRLPLVDYDEARQWISSRG